MAQKIKVTIDPLKGIIQERIDSNEQAQFIISEGIPVIVNSESEIKYHPEDPANWPTVPNTVDEALNILIASSSGGGGSPGGSNGDIQYRVNSLTFGGTNLIKFVGGEAFVTASFLGDLQGSASFAASASYADFALLSNQADSASFATSLQNELDYASTLTYIGGFPNTKTTFGNWNDLYDAYLQISGAVDIYIEGGLVLDSVTPVTYSFKRDTSLKGASNAFGANTFINLRDNVSFKNLTHFEGIQLVSEHNNSPALIYDDPIYTYPNIYLERTTFWCSGSQPMISWSGNKNFGQLNIELQHRSRLTSSIGPVIYVSGSEPSPNNAQINLYIGEGSEVFAETLASNPDSNIQIDIRSVTGIFNHLTQSNISGTLNESVYPLPVDNPTPFGIFGSSNTFLSIADIQAQTITAGSTSINPPAASNPFGIPGRNVVCFRGVTTDATPLNIYATTVPPVLSALFSIDVVARDATTPGVTFDTYAAELRGIFIVDAISGGQFGPLGLSAAFDDRTPGASTWAISSSLNTPNLGDFRLYVIGEVGKTINWTIFLNSTLGVGL